MKFDLKFGTAVTVIPSSATEKIISGAATAEEIAVLMAVARLADTETATEAEYVELIEEATALDSDTVRAAIAFWRGASVIAISGKNGRPSGLMRGVNAKEDYTKETKPTQDAEIGIEAEDVASAQTDAQKPVEGEKKLIREELPKYDPETISSVCGRDGGALREVIDQCQQIAGRMFNTTEVAKVVALNDYLGLEPEYILMLFAYYSRKKPGCKIHYIEKTAYSLVDEGIVTPAALDEHIRNLEIYDGVAGNLRRLLGIGNRAFTKKENTKLNHWICDFGFGSDVIEYCYETTVNNIGEFSFDYADKMLEGWFTEGVRSVEQARDAIEKYRMEHEKKSPSQAVGGITASSFDGDEFLALAIKRSMGEGNPQ
ncbi:MAG: DnaD domain protein [Clostridia bacterium]|nr:DnaD domain protein [Clostridia bacterium]